MPSKCVVELISQGSEVQNLTWCLTLKEHTTNATCRSK